MSQGSNSTGSIVVKQNVVVGSTGHGDDSQSKTCTSSGMSGRKVPPLHLIQSAVVMQASNALN